jgi:hypothetical protein
MSEVRIRSNGDTVHVMKKPATKALEKLVRTSFLLQPAARAEKREVEETHREKKQPTM